jgi:hypothetical protein
MAPRTTRSSSAKPAEAPAVAARSARQRRGRSQPAHATGCSSTTANRVQKLATRAQSVTSMGQSRRATSVTSVRSAAAAAAAKLVQKGLVGQPVAGPARSGYGDAHASREYAGMQEYAKAARKAGLVDEETLEKLCHPWQAKGVLEMQWKEEYLLPGVAEAEPMMDLKAAEAIAKKKDAAEKKYLEEYFDGGGRKTVEKEKKKDPLKTVASGKIFKKSSASSSRKPSSKLAIIIEDDDQPAPAPPSKPALAAPLAPLPGCPDYAGYNYYELASICFERNLVSGGNAQVLRTRLIQDDINVIQDLPREAKSYSKEKVRGRKNTAPVVPNAPRAAPAVYKKSASAPA